MNRSEFDRHPDAPQELEGTVTISIDEYRTLLASGVALNMLRDKRVQEAKESSYLSVTSDDYILGTVHYVNDRIHQKKEELLREHARAATEG